MTLILPTKGLSCIKRKSAMDEYECRHCKGKARITVLEDSEKATEPIFEFCPFCGMSNAYSRNSITEKIASADWKEKIIKEKLAHMFFEGGVL